MKTTLAAMTAPALVALAIGLAGTASAEATSGGASDTIDQLRSAGHSLVVNKTGNAPLGECSVIALRQDRHEHHGGDESDKYNTVYVDVMCPTTAG